MKWQILYRSQAFGPGSQLWFIAGANSSEIEKTKSSLTNKIDWYLNFQLTKAHKHKPQHFSNSLKSIVSENNLPSFTTTGSAPQPLMIVASEQLPTSAVIEVPIPEHAASWPKSVHEIWKKFGQPSLRVFLPPKISAEEFKTLWPDSSTAEMTIVPA